MNTKATVCVYVCVYCASSISLFEFKFFHPLFALFLKSFTQISKAFRDITEALFCLARDPRDSRQHPVPFLQVIYMEKINKYSALLLLLLLLHTRKACIYMYIVYGCGDLRGCNFSFKWWSFGIRKSRRRFLGGALERTNNIFSSA